MTNDEVKDWLVRSIDNAAKRRERKTSIKAYTDENRDAYVAYLVMRDSVESIPNSLIRSYVGVRERLDPCQAAEIESIALRAMESRNPPKSAAAFLEGLAAELRRAASLDLRSLEPASAARH